MGETVATTDGIQQISKFRRYLPQFLGSCAKNLLIFSMGEFVAFVPIVIGALNGASKEFNPDESLQIIAVQTSWLASFAHMAHPIGSLLSGPICDKIGRRKMIMIVALLLIITWFILGFAYSFPIICFEVTVIGFCFGLKEAPSLTYISEISEPAIRGTLASIASFSFNLVILLIFSLGLILPWRQVSLLCTIGPFFCLLAVIFVPESPIWLLSKNRPKDAQRSLQWLRGWVSPQTIHKEFTELQAFSNISNACAACDKQSIRCYHPKASLFDQIKNFKRKRYANPCILMFSLIFFNEFSAMIIWQSYIIQVLNALGSPIHPNWGTVLNSAIGFCAAIFLTSTIKKLGRRKIYLTSTLVVIICSFMLSIYGFILLPPGWTSFKRDSVPISLEQIREMVGDYNYLALVLVLIMQFGTKIGLAGMPFMYLGEVYPFKVRSLLCGITTACQFFLTSIAAKTYYNVEMWCSLPGAILFYGIVNLFGFFLMVFILPETDNRSLEDIEMHFSDKKRSIFDINICIGALKKDIPKSIE